MLNINELEQRYKQYKIKSYLPVGIITISLLIIVPIIIVFSLQETELPQIEQKSVTPVPVVKKTTITTDTQYVSMKPVATQKRTKRKPVENLIINPSLNFIQKIDKKQTNIIKEKPAKTYHIKTEKIVPQKIEVASIQQAETATNTEQEKSNSINISRQSTHQDIEDVIKRFNKNNNPALSLFVAKKYYELGDYEKSYNYALITNEINNDIESSWIIFSKSLVKLNKKEKAVSTLRKYIKYSASNRASMLLDSILSGKFK